MQTQKQYISNIGARCPICDSEMIEGSSINIDGNTATQDIHCNDCGAGWYDFYNLAGFELTRG